MQQGGGILHASKLQRNTSGVNTSQHSSLGPPTSEHIYVRKSTPHAQSTQLVPHAKAICATPYAEDDESPTSRSFAAIAFPAGKGAKQRSTGFGDRRRQQDRHYSPTYAPPDKPGEARYGVEPKQRNGKRQQSAEQAGSNGRLRPVDSGDQQETPQVNSDPPSSVEEGATQRASRYVSDISHPQEYMQGNGREKRARSPAPMMSMSAKAAHDHGQHLEKGFYDGVDDGFSVQFSSSHYGHLPPQQQAPTRTSNKTYTQAPAHHRSVPVQPETNSNPAPRQMKSAQINELLPIRDDISTRRGQQVSSTNLPQHYSRAETQHLDDSEIAAAPLFQMSDRSYAHPSDDHAQDHPWDTFAGMQGKAAYDRQSQLYDHYHEEPQQRQSDPSSAPSDERHADPLEMNTDRSNEPTLQPKCHFQAPFFNNPQDPQPKTLPSFPAPSNTDLNKHADNMQQILSNMHSYIASVSKTCDSLEETAAAAEQKAKARTKQFGEAREALCKNGQIALTWSTKRAGL